MKKLKLEELGRVSIDEYKKAEKIPISILLDNIRSLHNVGSAFRTADAFRIAKVFLAGITGKPPHREIQKTALGATESVAWEHLPDITTAIKKIKSSGYSIIVIEQTSESIALNNFNPERGKKYCLVFGNEVNGVSEKIIAECDLAVDVPQSGTKHSLNVSVCVGIVVWHILQKLK